MKRIACAVLAVALLCAAPLRAQEMPMMPKPDDRVTLTLAAEGWVTTKTARVTVNVEAAVNGANEGGMRADMIKAVGDVAKTDWRMTTFNRSQDQTGLERWSAGFEARLPENELGGLDDNAKKASKAGMQISVGEIDFSPTLDETEAAKAALRAQIYKSAADQLAALNAALPGRNYRIGSIDFMDNGFVVPHPMPRGPMMANAMAMPGTAAPDMPAERSEKVTLTARVVLAASPAAAH